MIDIREELLSIEKDWNRKYISIYSLFQILKKQNSTISYKDIAKYLLVKLKEYNPELVNHSDYPDIFFQDDCLMVYGSEFEAFTTLYGFACYEKGDDNTAKNLTYKSNNLFFDFLKVIKNNNFSPDISIELDIFGLELAYINKTYIDKEKIETALEVKFNQENLELSDIAISELTSRVNGGDLLTQLTAKDEEILRLKEEIENLKKPELTKDETEQEQAQSIQLSPVEEEPQGRISKAQRALFALLLSKLYPNGDVPNTNALKESINIELNKIGLSDVSYNTIAGLMKKT